MPTRYQHGCHPAVRDFCWRLSVSELSEDPQQRGDTQQRSVNLSLRVGVTLVGTPPLSILVGRYSGLIRRNSGIFMHVPRMCVCTVEHIAARSHLPSLSPHQAAVTLRHTSAVHKA
jgi:hypothetical protein